MPEHSAEPYLPERRSLTSLRKAVQGCRGCPLYRDATQAVFGHGPRRARLMLVGEQPGDQEDRKGAPFVGPAGKLLDRALADAGIDRDDAFLTNAVKHFKFTMKGSRRLHAKPGATEVVSCWPWLREEIHAVEPTRVVALGAVAARSLFGRPIAVTKERGKILPAFEDRAVLVTVHPSSVLRAQDQPEREAAYARLVDDLALARKL